MKESLLCLRAPAAIIDVPEGSFDPGETAEAEAASLNVDAGTFAIGQAECDLFAAFNERRANMTEAILGRRFPIHFRRVYSISVVY